MSDFVHLHVHTQYSFLDSSIKIPALIDQVKAFGMGAVALTDHDAMFGAVDFYKACVAQDIKPILGFEASLAEEDACDEQDPGRFQIVLLARNNEGYRNLCRLNHRAYSDGMMHGHPRLDRKMLEENSSGLLMLTGNLAGDIPQLLLRDDYDAAKARLEEYRTIFGADHVFVELTDHGIAEEKHVNGRLIELARDVGAPLVATNDVHYLHNEDQKAHEVLMAIQLGRVVDWDDQPEDRPDGFHLASEGEMQERFKAVPEALANTKKIADLCDVTIEMGTYYLPRYDCPEGMTLGEVLKQLSEEGLKHRVDEAQALGEELDRKSYQDRLEMELEIIVQMEFPGYFLTVADYVQWARNEGVPVGPGRGSGAGSLVAFALRITDIDPCKYGLLFERFLNPERVSMPDFDVDFCQSRRQEVINYAIGKYGADNVGQIITYGSMKAKAVVRDVARGQGMTPQEGDKIAKLIPTDLGMTLETAYDKEPRLRTLIEEDPRYGRLFESALKLEGLYRQAGIHASAVVISDEPLWNYMPTTRGSGGELVTQYAMNETEEVGLVKFDFLGLRTLTVLDHAERLVRRHVDPEFHLADVRLNDKETYKLISSGNTLGIFQLESSGFQELLRKLKPDCFEDIVAAVALYRPGPLGSGMVDDFVKRKHGQTAVEYPHPKLEEVLKETYGVIVYQEQVMRIASILAGFSLGQADLLRRAMGKKKESEMKRMRQIFMEGTEKNKVDPKRAEGIFDLMAYFAGYGFNKSHSAAYAVLTFQTAYLKKHYPAAFLAAMLTSESHKTDKVVRYVLEARRMGLEVLPPDVSESDQDFTLVENGIRFGLGAIRGVGESAIDAVLESRQEDGAFGGLEDFCSRVDLRRVNKRTVEALVSCGTFDGSGYERDVLLHNVSRAVDYGARHQRDKAAGQFNLFGGGGDDDDAPIQMEYGIPTERLSKRAILRLEKAALGFYVSGHPLEGHSAELKELGVRTTEAILENGRDGEDIMLGGVVAILNERRARSGNLMGIVSMEDLLGRVETVVFPKVYAECAEVLNDDLPIVIKGRIRVEEEGGGRQVSVIADRVQPLGVFRVARAKSVTLAVPNVPDEKNSLESFLSRLDSVVRSHPGAVPLFANVVDPEAGTVTVAFGEGYKVSPTDAFLAELREIIPDPPVIRSRKGPASVQQV
jgi:DNA polymerase-3 subunit alpha